jgi:hypothetical protein
VHSELDHVVSKRETERGSATGTLDLNAMADFSSPTVGSEVSVTVRGKRLLGLEDLGLTVISILREEARSRLWAKEETAESLFKRSETQLGPGYLGSRFLSSSSHLLGNLSRGRVHS